MDYNHLQNKESIFRTKYLMKTFGNVLNINIYTCEVPLH